MVARGEADRGHGAGVVAGNGRVDCLAEETPPAAVTWRGQR
jgi:hypothetical protein